MKAFSIHHHLVFINLCFCAIVISCKPAATSSTQSPSGEIFEYQNPISNGIDGGMPDGQYYLFYSSWSRVYEIGYAIADHPLGPRTKYKKNPIYGALNQGSCRKYNVEFTRDLDNPWAAVVHSEVFEDPDGRLWLSCYGILNDEPIPYLVIDPIDFVDGTMKINGPTHT